jgi:hypothetical protein
LLALPPFAAAAGTSIHIVMCACVAEARHMAVADCQLGLEQVGLCPAGAGVQQHTHT